MISGGFFLLLVNLGAELSADESIVSLVIFNKFKIIIVNEHCLYN